MKRRYLVTGSLVAIGTTTLPTKASQEEPTMNDYMGVINSVNRIAIMADLRDWQAVRACFAQQVETDYTSLFGGKPTITTPEALTKQWQEGFDRNFKTTQHLLGSHSVDIKGNVATCLSHFQARHEHLDPKKGIWVLGGYYNHELMRADNGWLVRKMKMTWTWEEGNR